MYATKKQFSVTVSGDAAKELQQLARYYGIPVEDVVSRAVALTIEYERLGRQGYHLGVSKEVANLDIRFTGIWP
jgi:hypothetical protein